MSTNINKAGAMSALAEGAKGLTQGIEDRPAALLAKRKAEQDMEKINYSDDQNIWKEELDVVKGAAEETNRKLQKANMFRGLKYFTEDRNPRHLNALLEGGPMSKAGIIRFSKIDLSADTALLSAAGLDPEDASGTAAFGGESYGDSARFVKGVMKDGTEKIFDVYQVKKMTGYFQSINDQQVTEELALNEKTYSPGEWEKKADLVASQGVDTKQNATAALYNDMRTGNKGGQLAEAEVATQALDKLFAGDFLTNFEPTDQQHRDQAYSLVHKIERMEGTEFDAATKKELRDVGVLLAMGDPSKDMTVAETGILDSMLTDVKKYVTDEGGSESVAAYAAFRNSLRHALYGSALTDSEIKAFNEQFGTRKQQLAPLIKQMKTAMGQIRGKLNAIATMQNPYSAKFRIGASQEKVEDLVAAMDQRIKYLEDLESGKQTESTPEAQQDKDSRIIGDVWGGNK